MNLVNKSEKPVKSNAVLRDAEQLLRTCSHKCGMRLGSFNFRVALSRGGGAAQRGADEAAIRAVRKSLHANSSGVSQLKSNRGGLRTVWRAALEIRPSLVGEAKDREVSKMLSMVEVLRPMHR